MSNLHCKLGYSTGEFQDLQRIALAVFGSTYVLSVGPLFGNLIQTTVGL